MAFHCGRRCVAASCGLLLSLTAGACLAVNLLVNPGFDTNLAGWDNPYGYTANWSATDSAGNGSSGSALLTDDLGAGNNSTLLVLSQCIAVAPQTTYTYGGRVRVPAGQPLYTRGNVFVLTYAGEDCNGSVLQGESIGSDLVDVWEFVSRSITTDPTVHRIRLALGVYKESGVTQNASALFDNVFLETEAGPGGFTIRPAMSATWYDPAQSGHGIMVHLLDSGSAWMCWFTFDLAGKRAWICSLGTISGDTLNFNEAFVVEGGKFPPLFDPGAIVEVPWGQITVTFTSCDNGTMSWTTAADGFQSGSMPIARLTPLWGVPCP